SPSTSVDRWVGVYAGHAVTPDPFGSPVRAKLTHAPASSAASCLARGTPPPCMIDSDRWNTNETSTPCTAAKRPSNAGDGHVNRYLYAGAPPWANLRSARVLELRNWPRSVRMRAMTRNGEASG